MDLYRYISFEEFMSIVTLKHLHFVQPTQWADTYEGCMYRLLDNDKNKEFLLSKLYDSSAMSDENSKAMDILLKYYRILMVRHNWFGQCWTDRRSESDAFWRIYSHNNGAIRISTSVQKFEKILNPEKYNVEKKKVIYDDMTENDLLEPQIELLVQSNNITESYFHKRRAFSHEHEYRILVFPKTDSDGNEDGHRLFLHSVCTFTQVQLNQRIKEMPIKDKQDCVTSCIKIIKSLKYEPSKASQLYIPINSASDLITDVLVTPLAADWYVDLVKGVCDQNGITFAGKSHLYDAVL